MKVIFIIFMFLSLNSFSAGLGACSEDTYMSNRIEKEIPSSERVLLYKNGQYVGVLQVYLEEMVALYLCGDNSGYYYADGSLKNLKDNRNISIYNDEYDLTITKVINDVGRVQVYFSVDGHGARDYENFSSAFEFRVNK